MKVYVTATFKNDENRQEIEQQCSIIKNAGFEDFCFIRDIEHYQKTFSDPKKLMARAKEEISKCDAILFSVTEELSTGRIIEVGIAYSLNKKIIVIMKEGMTIKDTLRGVADSVITYQNIEDIQSKLSRLLANWKN